MGEKIKLGRLSRDFHVTRAEVIDSENRRVELSFSSDTPVLRKPWFGEAFYEVLDHSPNAVRMDRIRAKGPVRWGHWGDVVGVVESAELADGKGRATVRFSKHTEDAERVFREIEDGILGNVSVGYHIHRLKTVEAPEGKPSTKTAIDWEPVHIAIVPEPADITVGVGRSEDENEVREVPVEVAIGTRDADADAGTTEVTAAEPRTEDRTMSDKATAATAAELDAARSEAANKERTSERGRVTAISQIRSEFARLEGIDELANSAIGSDTSVEDFQRSVLTLVGKDQQDPTRSQPDEKDQEIGMSGREIGKYSIFKAIRAAAFDDWSEAGLEREASAAAAKKYGGQPKGFFVPRDILMAPVWGASGQRASVTLTTGAGLVGSDHLAGSFIDALRERALVFELGATVLDGLVGDIDIPKKSAVTDAHWVGEATDPAESSMILTSVNMAPETISGRQGVTRKMLLQSAPAIEGIVRDDMLDSIGLGVDKAAFQGSGTTPVPRGVLNQGGIGAVVTGGNFTYDHAIDLESELGQDNAIRGRLAYVTSYRGRGFLKKEKIDAGSGEHVWKDNEVNGYPAFASNNVPDNLGAGTNETAVIFGNWADLLVAMWGPLDVRTNPFHKDMADSGGVMVNSFQDANVAVRHPQSFAAAKDVTA